MFDYYIAFDPSIWWNDQKLLKAADQHLNSFPTTSKAFWFAASGTKGIFKPAQELADQFKNANLKNVSWKLVPKSKEKHDTIFRATKESALIWIWNQK